MGPEPKVAAAEPVRSRPDAPKRSAEGPLKIASSAFDYFQDDFWRDVSMSGSLGVGSSSRCHGQQPDRRIK
ncbi:MAG: hypothetical protein ACR2PO_17655 [Methyloligellaceae bacterium]